EFVSEESFSLNSALQEHDYGTGEFNPAVMYILKLHHHQDRLGVTDYLTAGKDGKAMGYVTYDDWGALTAKAVLNCRLRQLDLVQDYTGHPYDQVLAAYYAPSKGWLHYSAEADSSLDDYFAGMAEMPPDPSFVPRLTALVNLQEFIDHMRKFGFDYPIIQYDGGTWYADDSFSKTIGSVPTMVVIVPGYLVREYFEKYICNNPLGSGQLTAIAANVIANGIETWLFGKKEKLAFASFYTRILRGSTGSEKEVLRDKTPYNETPYKRLV
ncbi:MAG: hypothetical protein FWG42_10410, partial [Clostridiales bacterium]|nr:hypothetical protein [Clostridiales bacterium]